MQDSIRKIISKFRDHDPLRYSNKENNCRQQAKAKEVSSNKNQKQSKRINSLETTIDALTTDANRVVRYYQEIIQELVNQNDQLREEAVSYKDVVQQEKREFEVQITELNEKIETLNNELNVKSIECHDLFLRYQDYEENTEQLRNQDEDCFKNIQARLNKETSHFEEKISESELQVKSYKSQLDKQLKSKEEYHMENEDLRRINNQLIQTLYYHQYIELEGEGKEPENDEGLISDTDSLNSCEVVSLKRDEDRFSLIEVDMHTSSERNFNQQKEVLDISEHYSKFNRTDLFLSKEKGNLSDMMNSNEVKIIKYDESIDKSFIRRGIISFQAQNNSAFMKINTVESKSETLGQPNNDNKIQEIQEFQMINAKEEQPMVDPYRAFFSLLVQSQKMNSPNFQRILDRDVTYRYEELVEKGVPFNQWQQEIRNSLKPKLKNTQ